METRRIWTGISHGFHTVERDSEAEGVVHAQREQVEGLEFWLLGVYDQQMSYGVTNYLQSNLFGNDPTEYQIRRKVKETMKKAFLSTKAKIQEEQKENSIKGASSVLVMNGERFVTASVGDYGAVLCRDGLATQLGMKSQWKSKRKWAISDIWNMRGISIRGEDNQHKSSRVSVSAQKVKPEAEFMILGSDGIWEVMRNQEAVNLIGHIEDAQKAAECLAEEALNRMSKSVISCVVIRFH